jgi:Tol biopolymer transport system component
MTMTSSLVKNKNSTSHGDRFDLVTGSVIVLLVALIFLVIALGDQIGTTVQNYQPKDKAPKWSPIQATFDEAIDPASAVSKITIDPPVDGTITVSERKVIFQPKNSLPYGQTYTVTVQPGIRTLKGHELKEAVQWTFSIQSPRLVYLAPVDRLDQNLYIVDPDAPESPQQLTFSTGVLSFDVSPDGRYIAYSELSESGSANLFLWDAATGESSMLLECFDATCNNPVWRPDGGAIAFERTDLNSGTGMAYGVSRIWVIDFATNTVSPVFNDTQQIGYSARWSPDRTKLGAYNANVVGIMIHDFSTGEDFVIQTPQGEIGKFSPNGQWLYFPKIVDLGGGAISAHLVFVDMSSDLLVQHDLSADTDPNSDVDAMWLPDSKSVVVSRRPPYKIGVQGAQLYQVNLETRESKPLVVDEAYTHGDVSLSPTGDVFAFRRFAIGKEGARPEIWTYNLKTGQLKMLVFNAQIPRWMP